MCQISPITNVKFHQILLLGRAAYFSSIKDRNLQKKLQLPIRGLMGERDPERNSLERMVGIPPDYIFYIVPKMDHMEAGDALAWQQLILRHLTSERAKVRGVEQEVMKTS